MILHVNLKVYPVSPDGGWRVSVGYQQTFLQGYGLHATKLAIPDDFPYFMLAISYENLHITFDRIQRKFRDTGHIAIGWQWFEPVDHFTPTRYRLLFANEMTSIHAIKAWCKQNWDRTSNVYSG